MQTDKIQELMTFNRLYDLLFAWKDSDEPTDIQSMHELLDKLGF
ncbi:MAG: hypothetical protein ACI85I_002603 [Arenicella sp.]|jgi:hypothetical protein